MNEPCTCPDPSLCKRLGRHINGRLWDIWNNKVLTPEKCAQYRQLWEKDAVKGGEAPVAALKSEVKKQTDKIVKIDQSKIKTKPCGCKKAAPKAPPGGG